MNRRKFIKSGLLYLPFTYALDPISNIFFNKIAKAAQLRVLSPFLAGYESNLVAKYRFEDSPGFTADSAGSNTLTNNGADGENSIIMEGSQSAHFVRSNTDNMYCTDANLDSGFPWRYDDTPSEVKDYSFAFWVRLDTLPSSAVETYYICCKWAAGASDRVFAIWVDHNDNKLYVNMGITSGTDYDSVGFGTAFIADRWYFCGISYTDSTRNCKIRIWGNTEGDYLGSDVNDTFTGTTVNQDLPFWIGARSDGNRYADMYLDKFMVYDTPLPLSYYDTLR